VISMAVGVRSARLQQIAVALDAAPSGGLLHLITVPRTDAGAALTTQTLLASLRLANPCTATLTGAVLTLMPLAPAIAQRSGLAAWARLTTGDGTWVMDLDIGLESDPDTTAEVLLDRLQLYAGGLVTVRVAQFVE
jgi:hypothetical protein